MATITLSDAEVREALAKALSEKTQFIFGEFDVEECYFTVMTANGEAQDVEEVTFTGTAA